MLVIEGLICLDSARILLFRRTNRNGESEHVGIERRRQKREAGLRTMDQGPQFGRFCLSIDFKTKYKSQLFRTSLKKICNSAFGKHHVNLFHWMTVVNINFYSFLSPFIFLLLLLNKLYPSLSIFQF